MKNNPSMAKFLSALLAIVLLAFGGQQVGIFEGDSSTSVNQAKQIDAVDDDLDISSATEKFSDLDPIDLTELPVEAITTLRRIDNDEAHPYDKDGSTFQNRERILPQRADDHYQEYTVDTPGENSRGARRIVTGQDGELYYTADHYQSFQEVMR